MLEHAMNTLSLVGQDEQGISDEAIEQALHHALKPIMETLCHVLLVPPDYTRLHSNAGLITRLLYQMLSPFCQVDILPALGTHQAVSPFQWQAMFGDIPYKRMIVHRWREDVVPIGQVPGSFVAEVSDGLATAAVGIEINKQLLDLKYDLVLSIGQVVPHEVIGMANHSKNIFVGCGGPAIINATHMLGAVYGMERIMGKDHSPARKVLDYAAEHLIQNMPLNYILTVTDAPEGIIRTRGLFIGPQRRFFEEAVHLARKTNLILLNRPIKKAVVYLDEMSFQSTWLGNKAIYRTRMAMASGGELVILAPGIDKFGEDPAMDALILKYGYRGRDYILGMGESQKDLRDNLSAAAHLIHGSSEGRFAITYCTRYLNREEVEGVGYQYLPYEDATERYPPQRLRAGWQQAADGEEIFYIPNPALGLWMEKSRLTD